MKVAFITFGCKLNQSETEFFKNRLVNKGFEVVPENRATDFFLINACAVTAKAEKEMRQKVSQIKRKYPRGRVIVTGCYIKQRNNKVDLWIRRDKLIECLGNQLIRRINNIRNSGKFACRRRQARLPAAVGQVVGRREAGKTRSFVKIQDGCDNYCSYCVVPFLRGSPKNRPLQEIISEIKRREAQGYKEIVLVGTDLKKVKSQKAKVKNLPDLLRKILKETNIPRIRISSLWPTAVTSELIKLVRKESRICPHFHLSIQSGCDIILNKMNRHYRANQVKKMIKNALSIPNLNLTADFIVGFPGESNKDFLETYKFIKSLPFLKLHVFRYSIRPITEAAKLKNQIDNKIKKQRSQKLRILNDKLSEQIKKTYLNQTLSVLFEEKIFHHDSVWRGLTANYLRIYAQSNKELCNQIFNVKLLKLYKDGIWGKIL